MEVYILLLWSWNFITQCIKDPPSQKCTLKQQVRALHSMKTMQGQNNTSLNNFLGSSCLWLTSYSVENFGFIVLKRQKSSQLYHLSYELVPLSVTLEWKADFFHDHFTEFDITEVCILVPLFLYRTSFCSHLHPTKLSTYFRLMKTISFFKLSWLLFIIMHFIFLTLHFMIIWYLIYFSDHY